MFRVGLKMFGGHMYLQLQVHIFLNKISHKTQAFILFFDEEASFMWKFKF